MSDKEYTNWFSMSDKALVRVLGEFVKYHRLEQNKTQDEIASAAGISRSTLSLLERGETVTVLTFIQILRVLDLLDIMEVFRVKKQISPMLLAKMEQKKRERARNTGKKLKR